MSDIPFTATLSTNEVFRGNDRTRFLSNDLDTIEAAITALQNGKAPADHTHSGYAAAEHTHSGYASTDHIHGTTNVAVEGEDLDDYNIAGVYSFAAGCQPTNRPDGTSNGCHRQCSEYK